MTEEENSPNIRLLKSARGRRGSLVASILLALTFVFVIAPAVYGQEEPAQDPPAAETTETETQADESAQAEGSEEAAPASESEEPAEGETSDEDTDGDEGANKEAEKAKGPAVTRWLRGKIDPIDKWFGKYLVEPMEMVFFYDFETGPKFSSGQEFIDNNGNGEFDQGDTVRANEYLDVTDKYGNQFEVQTDAEGKWREMRSEGWLGVSLPFVVIWLLLGALYLTLRMLFINIRGFFHAIALTMGKYDDPNDEGEVSHFQALSSALSATVGLGNIAGVAIAMGTGGPGATFWMVVIGLFGMSSKFTECTLGQMYRRVDPNTGRVSGGPMRYLKDGLKDIGMGPLGVVLASVFALLCIGASLGGGNAFQVGQSLDAIRGDAYLGWLDQNPYIYGLVLAAGVGVVIIGGIKSIGKVASRIVPFMCAAYVAMAVYIIVTNIAQVGPAFQSIWDNAFNWQAGAGAILGVMVIGIQRAVFSNEAGTGSAAIAHSAAKTEEPVSEGIVALLEPFIDTVVICTMTAVVIIIGGGKWVPQTNEDALLNKNYGQWTNQAYVENMEGEKRSGAALTVSAVSAERRITTVGEDGQATTETLPPTGMWWFKYVLYAAVILFAYSTLISWYYYGERCWTFLFTEHSSIVYKILFLSFTVLGSIITTGKILDFSDLLILSLALPNMLGLFLLSGVVKRKLDEYLARKRSGELRKH